MAWVSTRAERVVLAALRYGPLDRHERCWRFGHRRFASKTVARLIEAGKAVRLGDVVRLA